MILKLTETLRIKTEKEQYCWTLLDKKANAKRKNGEIRSENVGLNVGLNNKKDSRFIVSS